MLLRTLAAAALLSLAVAQAQAQTSPGLSQGQQLTAGQWNALFASKQDTLGFPPLNTAGGTMTGPLNTAPSTTATAGMNVPQGDVPTSPNPGDFWATPDGLFYRAGSTTQGPFGEGGGGSLTEVDTGAGLSGGPCTTTCTITLEAPVAVGSGGTGVTTLPDLATAMGLGTMSTQDAGAVAIAGGSLANVSVTGLPAPTVNSDAATKAYVDSTAAGLTPLAASNFVTVAALPANTYSNGTLGVGATLTENANGALSVDGVAVSTSQIVVVNNEAAPANNGIYSVTATGGAGAPYVLTRVTYFDQASEMVKNAFTTVTGGNTQVGTGWILSAAVPTVGTSAVNFTLFSASPLNSLPSANIFVGNGSNIATARAMSGDAVISNTGAVTVSKTGGVAFAASATTNALNAANISSGTLPAARLPNPSASTLGGVESLASASHQWINTISTSGVPTATQPSFSDISGTAAVAQGGTSITSYTAGDIPYSPATNTLGKLGIGSTNQVLTVVGGLPAWAASAGGSIANNYTTAGTATWTKPTSGTVAYVQCWGAGGSGGRQVGGQGSGGGGGAYSDHLFSLSTLASTVTVTIGAGGAARTSGNTTGAAGGNSSFGALLVAYGGGGGGNGNVTEPGAGGGGQGSAGSVGGAGAGAGGTDLAGQTSVPNGAGGSGTSNTGGVGYDGGAAGGAGISGAGSTGADGGDAVYGSGGGSGSGTSHNGAAGTSVYGGNGSAGAASGAQPGGGGGGVTSGNSGPGGNGECIVTSW